MTGPVTQIIRLSEDAPYIGKATKIVRPRPEPTPVTLPEIPGLGAEHPHAPPRKPRALKAFVRPGLEDDD